MMQSVTEKYVMGQKVEKKRNDPERILFFLKNIQYAKVASAYFNLIFYV